jgi:hypothetical protein
VSNHHEDDRPLNELFAQIRLRSERSWQGLTPQERTEMFQSVRTMATVQMGGTVPTNTRGPDYEEYNTTLNYSEFVWNVNLSGFLSKNSMLAPLPPVTAGLGREPLPAPSGD